MFFMLWHATVRFKYSKKAANIFTANRRVIVLFWHNRIFISPMLKRRFRKQHRMSGLVSPSRDGAWLAAAFKFFKVEIIRGSSKRRGGLAIKEMVGAIADGSDICITPDGPRGPKYSIKKGALKVAELSGADIMIIRAKYRHYFKIGTWDDFMFPLPFSTVDLEVEPLINFEEACRRGETQGIGAEKYIENALGKD
jgi:lysophospholipid acyltransferase (LPLAT)-like uncharacterized protein